MVLKAYVCISMWKCEVPRWGVLTMGEGVERKHNIKQVTFRGSFILWSWLHVPVQEETALVSTKLYLHIQLNTQQKLLTLVNT